MNEEGTIPERNRPRESKARPVVCVQGLGYVGAITAIAVADARDSDGSPHFEVVGVDLPTPSGKERIASISEGRFPFPTTDPSLAVVCARVRNQGNLSATLDPKAYAQASVVLVDVNLDVEVGDGTPRLRLEDFRRAIRAVGENIREGCLVIVESTVPPGTCERVVSPELRGLLRQRGLPPDSLLLAHSYERVMPGPSYYDSVVNYWRVYAGETPAAADACEQFLSKVVHVDAFPLSRLASTTASELGKVLENSYRATLIAFMEEWGRLAEELNVDIYEIIDAIRIRPTHANMRQPGFGVGGYCLTKDPLMGELAAREILDLPHLNFPFSTLAVEVNRAMPLVSLEKLRQLLGGLKNKKILLLGVSYRSDVGDTRYSPSADFVKAAKSEGANVICHDPFVNQWTEIGLTLPRELPSVDGMDAVVLGVPHSEYRQLDFLKWIGGAKPVILDAVHLLNAEQSALLVQGGCQVYGIGRGVFR